MNRRSFLSSLGILATLPTVNLKQVIESKPVISLPLFYQVNLPTFLAFHLDKTKSILQSQPIMVSTFKYEGKDVLEHFVKQHSRENHVMIYSVNNQIYDPMTFDRSTYIRAALLPKSKNWILQSYKPRYEYTLEETTV